MRNYRVLSANELVSISSDLPGWSVVESSLCAEFTFQNFREAIAFINLVAFEAEVQNHHPTWANTYNRVEIRLCTHDANNRATDFDLKLAKYINQAAAIFLG